MPLLVAFGAGNVGRGFIGELFSAAGWDVAFLDVAPRLVERLGEDRSYIHETVSNSGVLRQVVTRVTAAYSTDQSAVDALVAEADLVTTSVGVRVLGAIAPALAHALQARWAAGRGALDVLLCENLHDASSAFRRMLRDALPASARARLETDVGLAETSIGRMIPTTPPAPGQPPTLVRAEPYRILPYDATGLTAPEPRVQGLFPVRDIPFSFYTDRKLLIHNMGHCACAYLGELLGAKFIWEAIAEPRVHSIVRAAMMESALALSVVYGAGIGALGLHVDDLLARFANRALGDTVERVGRDPERKLGADDRFIRAYALARRAGTPVEYLSLALAVGARRLAGEDGWDEARALAHVDAHLFPGGSPARDLFGLQFDSLAHGLDWEGQQALIDASPLRGTVV